MNLRPIRRGLVALVCVLLPALAYAQGVPAFQSGTVTPGHLLKGAGPGQHMDVGTTAGDANGRGVQPFAITDSLGLGVCTHSAPTGGQHYESCLGHDAQGNALWTVTANGGALDKSVFLSKNGVLYEIPFVGMGSGNVVGPDPSVVGNVPLFNAANGTLLKDSGVPLSSLRDSAALFPTARTTYVRAPGDGGTDGNDCLAATQGTGQRGPCETIQGALRVLLQRDAKEAFVTVNVGPGTFSAPVTVNGPMVGGTSSTNYTYTLSSPMVLIKGAGSGSTEIFGPATYLGSNYCYAILAATGARLALQNLSVRADGGGGSCLVSDLYVQDAAMYIVEDVLLKSATGNWIAMEENALLYVTPGVVGNGITLSGNASHGIVLDANSTFVSDSTVNISGATVLSGGGGCFIYAAYHSVFKITIPNPAFTSGGSVAGNRFCLDGLSNLVLGHPPAVWPGTLLGIASNGSRYQAPEGPVGSGAGACVGGTVGCPTATAPTGFGAGASFAISGGSGAYGGAIQITAGVGAGTSGGINIGLPYQLNRGACSAWFAQGTGSWNPQASTAINGFTTDEGLGISWSNNSVAPTNGSTYFVGYTCNTTQ